MDTIQRTKPAHQDLDSLDVDDLTRALKDYRARAPMDRASFARWWAGLPPRVQCLVDRLVPVIQDIQTRGDTPEAVTEGE